MPQLIDRILVGLVLLTSAAYALFALGPKALRRRMAASFADLAARASAIPGLRGPLQRLSASLGNKTQSSCGGCDNCGSEPAAKESLPAAEVRVPMTRIGLRRRSKR
ncbi:MAG: DUF6587 family protein [Steroidobacteraceae bacterium]|jgi:hypothetical protein